MIKKFIITSVILVTSLLTFSQDLKNFEIISQKTVAIKSRDANFKRLNDSGYIIWHNDNDIRPGYYTRAVRIDKSGNIKWNKVIDTTYTYKIAAIAQTSEDGFIICGSAKNQKMPDVRMPHSADRSNYDYWIEKIDSEGNTVWQKTYGGDQVDEATSIQQTKDGGYIVAGYTESFNKDVKGNHGGYDYWVLKLKADGTIEWKKAYGSPEVFVSGKSNVHTTASYTAGSEKAYYVKCTDDGGYLVAGNSEAYVFRGNTRYNSDVEYNHGGTDIWIIKLGGDGKIVWQISLAGKEEDFLHSCVLTKNNNLIVTVNTSHDESRNYYYLANVEIGKEVTWLSKIFDRRDGSIGIVNSTTLDTDSTLSIEGYYPVEFGAEDTTVIVKVNLNQDGKKTGETLYPNYRTFYKNNDGSINRLEQQKDSTGDDNVVLIQMKPKPTVVVQDSSVNKSGVKPKVKTPVKKTTTSGIKPKKPSK